MADAEFSWFKPGLSLACCFECGAEFVGQGAFAHKDGCPSLTRPPSGVITDIDRENATVTISDAHHSEAYHRAAKVIAENMLTPEESWDRLKALSAAGVIGESMSRLVRGEDEVL